MKRALFAASLLATLAVTAFAQDRSTPEATLRSFMDAFSKGDVKQAGACVKGAKVTDEMAAELSKVIKKDPATATVSDAKAAITGSTATLKASVTLKQGSRAPQTVATELAMESVGGNWLIVPSKERLEKSNGADVVNAIAFALTDSSVFSKARDSARQTSCLTNVRQVGLGVLMLVQDYDEKFKLKAATYKKSIMPYIKNESVFHCPSDKGTAPSYSFNANLAGINMAKIKAPAETVMVYEGANGKLVFRHEGMACVGFADGHVKLVNAEGAKKLRWMP